MAVARGRGVDEQEEPLLAGRRRRLGGRSVLGTEIDGRIRGQPAALQELGELASIVGREEDVVVDERVAGGAAERAPDHGRERAAAGGGGVDRAGDLGPEQPAREGGDVGVHDHRIGRKLLARGQSHATGAAALDQDLADLAIEPHDHPEPLRHPRQGAGERSEAALDQPDPVELGMDHEHQRGRGEEGRTAAIGGVAGEELAQPRVAEPLAQDLPQRLERADARQPGEAAQPHPTQEARQAGCGRAQERPLEDRPDARRLEAEGTEGARFGGAREGRDRRLAALRIGEEIEARAVRPPVPGEDLGAPRGELGLEPGAGVGQQLVEEGAQGEHGRAGRDRATVDQELAHLAARGRGALEQGHGTAADGELDRGGEPARPGADDEDPGRTRWHARLPATVYRK